MSIIEREGLYVYQPYGIQDGKERWNFGLIYGVGGLPNLSEIKGVTKRGAELIVQALAHDHTAECMDASGRCMITGEV